MRRSGVAVIVLIGTFLTGCAAKGYEPGALEQHLEKAGVGPAAAKCVVDDMTRTFGVSHLGGRADPTADELKAERALLAKCGATTVPK
jgi:hypothetical protein